MLTQEALNEQIKYLASVTNQPRDLTGLMQGMLRARQVNFPPYGDYQYNF